MRAKITIFRHIATIRLLFLENFLTLCLSMTITIIILALIIGALVFVIVRNNAALADARRDASVASERAELYKSQLDEMKVRTQNDTERFRDMASEIFTAQSDRLRTANEKRLSEILAPLSENIRDFRKAVNESYSAEARERFALDGRIRELVEANKVASREARGLATALRGSNQAQGNWGETVLENILEKSGLRKGEEYVVQATVGASGETLRRDDGKLLRPDVVINYPDGRSVVVDSKVSLTAFLDMSNADSPEARTAAASRHVESVRRHIDELAAKDYQKYVGERRTDFVLMFIPNEAAYMAAMQADSGLWERACAKCVLIVSPTLIISALRLIEQLWNRDRQTRNAIEIADAAGKMYDKFAGFVDDMARIDKNIEATRTAMAEAMKKLSTGTGNLVSRAEKLRELGAKASKQLRRLDSAVTD